MRMTALLDIIVRDTVQYPSGGSALVAVLIGVAAVTALFGTTMRRAFTTFRGNLLSIRERKNAFDSTWHVPLPAGIIAAVLFIVYAGAALYASLRSAASSFDNAAATIGIVAAYYVFQLIVYNLIGYAFGEDNDRVLWIEGFAASQACCGVALICPVLLLLCVPRWHAALTVTVAVIYLASRIIFICKGFRIFRQRMQDPLCFVLYICCIEVIPPLIIAGIVKSIS